MNLPSIIQEVYRALFSSIIEGWRRRQQLINAVAVITAAVVLWQMWFSYGQLPLVMFVGPPGSSTARVGPSVVEEVAKLRNASGVRYRVAIEPMLENVSISERMTFESTRVPLGIIEDSLGEGFADERADLRALIPMEWDYLFVLCSRTLLESVQKSPGETEHPATLAEIIHHIKREQKQRRLFLGPEKTSTYRMAQVALDKFGAPSDEYLARGITDWREMRAAFKAGELDLAFYSGPIGAGLIDEVANDGKVVLLGLGEITEAIQHETGFQYYAAKLPRNLVLAKARLPNGPSSKEESEVEFCRDGLTTIASRRVLACPKSLSAADGYLIASAARSALESYGYRINLEANDLPNGASPQVTSRLRMLPHPALELLRQGQLPFVWRAVETWPGWAQTVLWALLGFLALDVLRLLSGRIAPNAEHGKGSASKVAESEESGETPAPSDASLIEFDRLRRILASYESEVDGKTHREIASELPEWDQRLRDLRTEVHRSTGLTAAQREELRKRYRALEFEIEKSPRWVSRAPARKRSGGTPPTAASSD